MLAGTHVAFGLCAGTVMASFYANQEAVAWGVNGLTAAAVVAVVAGSVCPDLDHRQSPVGRLLPFVSRPLSRRWPHRTLTHSLVGLALFAGIVFAGLKWAWWGMQAMGWETGDHSGLLTLLFGFSFASHLVLDTCTRTGVRWLYPVMGNAFGYPAVEQYRAITGDRRVEWTVTTVSLAVALWLAPVTLQGADASLNNLIGQYRQLLDLYLHTVGKEVVLEFDGYTTQDKAAVRGSGVIVGVGPKGFECYWKGQVVTVGEEQAAIYLLQGRCRVLATAPDVTTLDVQGQTWAELVSVIGAMGDGVRLVQGEVVAERVSETEQVMGGEASRRLTFDWTPAQELVGRVEGTGGTTMTALEQRLREAEDELNRLMQKRMAVPRAALYERDRLFADILTQRGIVARLERQQRLGMAKGGGGLRWSGRLTVRRVREE